MGPRLGRVEYKTLPIGTTKAEPASMGPRLGRVEYNPPDFLTVSFPSCFNGATLRTRGIHSCGQTIKPHVTVASMGPRLGRVEYSQCSFSRSSH